MQPTFRPARHNCKRPARNGKSIINGVSSPSRKRGSRATAVALDTWIPALAGMTINLLIFLDSFVVGLLDNFASPQFVEHTVDDTLGGGSHRRNVQFRRLGRLVGRFETGEVGEL